MKKYFVKLIPVVVISALFVRCTSEQEVIKQNVIIIYTDDLGYGDVTCYNSDSKIITPNIDKLASDGMMFSDAHSAASFCTPSRYRIPVNRSGKT